MLETQESQSPPQPSEWRRGGPGKNPIDRPGVWEMRWAGDIGSNRYRIESIDGGSFPVLMYADGSTVKSYHTLKQKNELHHTDWRFISPLPSEGEPAAVESGGGKGDREPYKWQESDVTAMHRDNLRSAWRDTIRERDSLASQLEEARKETERLKGELKASVSLHAKVAERFKEVCSERDAALERVKELERRLATATELDPMGETPAQQIKRKADLWDEAVKIGDDLFRGDGKHAGLIADCECSVRDGLLCLSGALISEKTNRAICIVRNEELIAERNEAKKELAHEIAQGWRDVSHAEHDRVMALEKVVEEASDLCTDAGWRWGHDEQRNDSWLQWLRSRLSSSDKGDGEHPPLDHAEAIRRLWVMAFGQRDQIADLQERVKELESRA